MRKIYKYDTKGKLRVWSMEIDGSRYRTVAGIEGGSLVTSDWTQAKAKNVGKANETTAEQQAQAEVDAKYIHKLSREYHKDQIEARFGALYFKPMLAHTFKAFPNQRLTFGQPKLDGMRCIANKHGLFSRQGRPINSCPHIFEALIPAFAHNPNLVLDGELYNHDLKDDFPRLMSLCRKEKPTEEGLRETKNIVQFHVYDYPYVKENTFSQRYAQLEYVTDLLKYIDSQTPVRLVHTVKFDKFMIAEAEFTAFHARCIAEGYEGSILRLNKPYEQKRSKYLLKRKDFIDDEFEVVRLEEGEGNWAGAIKSVVCRAENGKEFGAGVKGTKEYAQGLVGKTFQQAKVRYFELTPDGVPRFGIVLELYEGKRND